MVMQLQNAIVPILSGGGTRLSCYIGILQALTDMGLSFRHPVGVSGGSIIAALYAVGWSIEDMKAIALKTDFRQFWSFLSKTRKATDSGFARKPYFCLPRRMISCAIKSATTLVGWLSASARWKIFSKVS